MFLVETTHELRKILLNVCDCTRTLDKIEKDNKKILSHLT